MISLFGGGKIPRTKQKNNDVGWHIPGKKKPFAYSTTATSHLIIALSQEYNTIEDVYNAINYDIDAQKILKVYIDKGFKDIYARSWFR